MPGSSVRVRGGIAAISRRASRVAEHTNIRDIRLMGSSSELKSFTSEGPLNWDLNISPSAQYKPGDEFFVLMIRYHVKVDRTEDSVAEDSARETEEVADISFQFGVLCELQRDDSGPTISQRDIEEYGDATAMIVLTPYVREYLHDVTMRMGLPPLVMDIIPSFTEKQPKRIDANRNLKKAG